MTQLVFLDFDTFTDPGEIEYSTTQRSEILENIAADYELFDFSFTLTEPTGGDFSTLFFNAGPTGGLAEKIDFRNLDKNDTATININGLVAPPEVTVVGLSSFIGAHELGHLQGLRHGDSFAPIGSGLPSTGIPPNFAYLPAYPGPANADETTGRIMASPASVGQQLPEANEDAFFSERSAVKLAFNEGGTVVSEVEPNNSIATAQAIEFVPLDVPNTLLSGDNVGKDFLVEALVVTGSLSTPGDEDFFSFEGNAGDRFQFEVLSQVLSFALDPSAISDAMDSNAEKSPGRAISDPIDPMEPMDSNAEKSPELAAIDPFGSEAISLDVLGAGDGGAPQVTDPINPQISILDSAGNLIPYFSDVAFNDEEFETVDSILIDLELPEDDTYFIKVNASSSFDTGEYELFGYNFEAVDDEEMNAIENGSFETGTFEDWRTIGDTSIKTEDFKVTPTDGSFQALLTNGFSDSGGSVEAEDLEEFLDLAPGVLDGLGNGPVTEGSAIKQTFDIDEPSILSFDWNFLTDEATPTIFNDFAFFTVNPVTLELADTNFPVFSSSDSLFNEETGYQGVSVAISEPGTYTLSFGVVDVLDEIVDSALLIDNVSVVPISTESTSIPDVSTLGSRDVLALTLGEENIPAPLPLELPEASELDAMIAERAMMFI